MPTTTTKKKTTKKANSTSQKKIANSESQFDASAKARIAATRAVFAVLDKQQETAAQNKCYCKYFVRNSYSKFRSYAFRRDFAEIFHA
jgi:phage-related tail fiber protein